MEGLGEELPGGHEVLVAAPRDLDDLLRDPRPKYRVAAA